jgi:hypothetical protein
MIDDVSEWTSKQWNRAKGEWTKEKEKWADCRKQSNDQNLTGLKSWSFLASCMTSRATAGRSSKRTPSSILSWGAACWDRLAAAAQSLLGSRLPVVNDIEMKAASSVSKVTICFQASVTDSSADPTGSACHLSLCIGDARSSNWAAFL